MSTFQEALHYIHADQMWRFSSQLNIHWIILERASSQRERTNSNNQFFCVPLMIGRWRTLITKRASNTPTNDPTTTSSIMPAKKHPWACSCHHPHHHQASKSPIEKPLINIRVDIWAYFWQNIIFPFIGIFKYKNEDKKGSRRVTTWKGIVIHWHYQIHSFIVDWTRSTYYKFHHAYQT